MREFAALLFSAYIVLAQAPTAPAILPRGVVNAYSQQPAPSVVAPGGLLQIHGINLGPVDGVKPDGLPLPTKLGDPAIEVLINNRVAPIVSASATSIVVQVPQEVAAGLATVVVRRGEQQSRVARVQVQALAPAVLSSNESGFGPAANSGSESLLKLRVSSIGVAAPRIANGEGATEATPPRATVRVYVGGLAAETVTTYSTTLPGEYDLAVSLPDGAIAGDPILIVANNTDANVVTNRRGPAASDVTFIPLPAGTPELRNLRSSDARGLFLTANALRGTDTCFPSYLIDAAKKTMQKIEGCLTTAQAQAASPFTDGSSAPTFAAFEGPFTGTATPGQPAPVSTKVRVFHPLNGAPVVAELPAMATNLSPTEGGDFLAVVPQASGAAKQYRIDARNGAVEEVTPAGNGAGAGLNAQALLQRFQTLDLGDGVDKLLSGINTVNNQIVITAGDNTANPAKAKVAVLTAAGDIVSKRDFPDGWLPIAAPAGPAPAGPGGAAALALRTPTPVYLEQQTRSYYVASRNASGGHGFVEFPADGSAAIAIAAPEGWYFTACLANMPVSVIDLARSVALLASKTDEKAFRTPCPADGYLLFDLATRRFSSVSLPGSGKLNAAAGTDEINDFLLGSNSDPANRNTSDTLYAFDGANGTVFRFDLPVGVNNFSGNNRIPALNLQASLANNRVAGDAGIVLFDLEKTVARLLPTPEGFVTVSYLGVLPALRKLVARGIKTGNSGAQLLVYNLDTGDVESIVNPDGVAWAGSPPPVAGAGQAAAAVNLPARVNAKANTIEAVTYGSDRKQAGVMVVRVF